MESDLEFCQLFNLNFKERREGEERAKRSSRGKERSQFEQDGDIDPGGQSLTRNRFNELVSKHPFKIIHRNCKEDTRLGAYCP